MISPIPPVTPQLPLLPLVNESKDSPSFSGLYAAVLQDTTEKIQRKKVELDQKVAQLNTIKKDKLSKNKSWRILRFL